MFSEVNDEKKRNIKKGFCFFSNSLEVLFEHLKASLFPKEEGVFAQRILIAPSQAMQQWIQMRLASSLEIASGVNFTFLDKGIEKVQKEVFEAPNGAFVPTRLHLFLRLADVLSNLPNEPLWAPVIAYLKKGEKRKIALAKHLALLFERYGIYASRAALEWEKSPSTWQEALWAKIFKEWDYPQRTLLSLKENEKQMPPQKLAVHLFAFSHISSLYFHFLCRAARSIDVYFYQLSPSQEFWSDLSKEETPLLGSLGKVGKEMARLIEENETQLEIEESYLVFGGNSKLKKLQRFLLTLEPLENSDVEEDSIQIHALSTPHQEIEHLYSFILKSGIEPKEIVVMAPNIALYAPFIQAIFGEKIDYQIADMPLQRCQPPVEALFLLLHLNEKRWSAPALLELFHHPLFSKKQGFKEEELLQIKSWVHSTGIRWAFDGNHRMALLKKGHCASPPFEASATWMEGLGYLIEELALVPDDLRYPRIGFKQAELLGQTVELLTALYADLSQLDTEKTLRGWVDYLRALCERYLATTEETAALYALFERMEKLGQHFTNSYSFSFFLSLFKECAEGESVTLNRHQLQAVRFCSMLPMRAIPASLICLIGMDYDAFPRKEELRSLDQLYQNPKGSYAPSRIDFDRYLFLEALLSARKQLYISYKGRDPYDLTPLPPSVVVSELLSSISAKIKEAPLAKPHMKKRASPSYAIPPFIWPQGEVSLTISDLMRFSRSCLRHYCHAQGLKIPEAQAPTTEEPFVLPTARRAFLRKKALTTSSEDLFEFSERRGDFPAGLFGVVAKKQLQEEIDSLSQQKLHSFVLPPFSLQITPSLTVSFSGILEHVFEKGVYLSDPCSPKGACKAWPLLLLLNAIDSSKTELFFAPSQKGKTLFFEDPKPSLLAFLEFFFLAQRHPFPLVADWIEPLLKKDLKKLRQTPIFDPYLQWHFRGKREIDYEQIISAYYPVVEKVYKEMLDVWF